MNHLTHGLRVLVPGLQALYVFVCMHTCTRYTGEKFSFEIEALPKIDG